ncbi:hypothetical protein D5086_009078 [Populus alba]|uniref:Uncharacterized protein n=1 Tax=Populus alba TaxID=43335 RepID=A0ACC4CIW2_POPAL
MHLLNFFWLTKHLVVVSRFRHSITLKSQHALTAAVDSEMQTKAYNNELLQAEHRQLGSVSTEILFEKDSGMFTLRNGRALPRRIYFGGEECTMPLPDTFPVLVGFEITS